MVYKNIEMVQKSKIPNVGVLRFLLTNKSNQNIKFPA